MLELSDSSVSGSRGSDHGFWRYAVLCERTLRVILDSWCLLLETPAWLTSEGRFFFLCWVEEALFFNIRDGFDACDVFDV